MNRDCFIVLLISVLSLVVVASGNDGVICGHIYDSETNEQISFAFVRSQEGKNAPTNADGYYAIDGCSPFAGYALTCFATGYQSSSKTITTDGNGNAEVDLYLQKEGDTSGPASAQKGIPLGAGNDSDKETTKQSASDLQLVLPKQCAAESISFSPDGRTLASGNHFDIMLWDVSTGSLLKTLTGHSSYKSGLKKAYFSPDGYTLASGGFDDAIKLWDVQTGLELKTLNGHSDSVISASFSPDGRTLASGSDDNTIKLWDVQTGRIIKTLNGHSDSVRCVLFSPDGLILASGSDDNTIKLWDVQTGLELKTLTGHSDSVISVSFSPDGRTLTSGSRDITIRLWEIETGQLLKTPHLWSGYCISISPDGRTVASGSGTIDLWDIQPPWRSPKTLTGHSGWVHCVSFSPDSSTLASGGDDCTIKLWDVQTGQLLKTLFTQS